jgi:single-strand DNA-binding protein
LKTLAIAVSADPFQLIRTERSVAMYQKIVIVGNLGNDPELRYTPQGDAVASFRAAVNRRWTDRDGQPGEETTWFHISVWGAQAEACKRYLSKGRLVLVEGRLIPDQASGGPRIWTGNDDQPRANFELRANTVRFLGSNNERSQEPEDDDAADPPAPIPVP